MRLIEELDALHATYVSTINAAVADDDLIRAERLAHDYDDEAILLIAQRENKTHLLPLQRPVVVRETSLRRLAHRLHSHHAAA